MSNHENGLTETEIVNKLVALNNPESQRSPGKTEPNAQAEEAGKSSIEIEQDAEESTNEPDDAQGSDEFDEESVYQIGDEQITLKELKALKSGNLRMSDYTQKTQALAEQRRELEANRAKIDTLVSKLDERIGDIEASIKDELDGVDWDELADIDPSEYLKKQAAVKRKQEKLEKAKAEKQTALISKAQEEIRALMEKTPEVQGKSGEELNTAYSAILNSATKAARDLGYADSELNTLVDHRFYMLALKAAKYDDLMAKKTEVTSKLASVPKVTPTNRTAAKKVTPLDDAKTRLAKSGRDNDAFDAMKAYMSKRGA